MRKIGEEFYVGNVRLRCVPDNTDKLCGGCYFHSFKECENVRETTGHCSSHLREDKTDVVFTEIKYSHEARVIDRLPGISVSIINPIINMDHSEFEKAVNSPDRYQQGKSSYPYNKNVIQKAVLAFSEIYDMRTEYSKKEAVDMFEKILTKELNDYE